jgi:dihydrofolate reductase
MLAFASTLGWGVAASGLTVLVAPSMGMARAVRIHLPYWGYGAPGLFEWIHGQLAEDHVMLMGATTYRVLSEIVATGDDPTFPRMAELPKIVFSKTLRPPLTWANTTVVAEPVETAVPALKAMADGTPMRTIGSPSLVRSLFRLGLVDRVRVMVFPTIRGDRGRAGLR